MNLEIMLAECVRLQGVRIFCAIPENVSLGMLYENDMMIQDFSSDLILKVKK